VETKPQQVVLGQEVFVLSAENGVTRTMVGMIRADGQYTLLNGQSNLAPHWLTYREALAAAQKQIKARMKNLARQIGVLEQESAHLKSREARLATLEAPYRVVDLMGDYPGEYRRTRQLKKILGPAGHLNPGDMVYVCITPQIQNSGLAYRPFDIFVLETKIKEVSFDPKTGTPRYTYTTPFKVKEHFDTQGEAKDSLRDCHQEKNIHFVPHEEEQEKIRIMMEAIEEDIPF
jgi:hypothetical protein